MDADFPHNLVGRIVRVTTSAIVVEGTFCAVCDWGGEIFFEIQNNEEPTYININCIHSIKEKK